MGNENRADNRAAGKTGTKRRATRPGSRVEKENPPKSVTSKEGRREDSPDSARSDSEVLKKASAVSPKGLVAAQAKVGKANGPGAGKSVQVKAGDAPADRAGESNPGGTVVVCLNRQNGISFRLSGGRTVVVNGANSGLRGLDRGVLGKGAFGMTVLPREAWEEIRSRYGKMALFANGLLFAADSAERAGDEAAEKRGLRHGLEPVAPQTGRTEAAATDAA